MRRVAVWSTSIRLCPLPVKRERFDKPSRTGNRHGGRGHPKDRPYENCIPLEQKGRGLRYDGRSPGVGFLVLSQS